MHVYTKRGDTGMTDLIGGTRVEKDDPRLEAYGTADELNSFIGLLRAQQIDGHTTQILNYIQNKLFNLGAYLATDQSKTTIGEYAQITQDDINIIEDEINSIENVLPQTHRFILPAGSQTVAIAHICRTVTRRLERNIIHLSGQYTIDNHVIQFTNRLSDYLFVLAKKLATDNKEDFIFWKK